MLAGFDGYVLLCQPLQHYRRHLKLVIAMPLWHGIMLPMAGFP
jgi:hypothetical protein